MILGRPGEDSQRVGGRRGGSSTDALEEGPRGQGRTGERPVGNSPHGTGEAKDLLRANRSYGRLCGEGVFGRRTKGPVRGVKEG